MRSSDLIDYGPFGRKHGVSLDGTPYWVGTSEYGEVPDSKYLWRYSHGRTCPGPGFGEPECGELIDNDAERCVPCAAIHRVLANGRDPIDAIRERPTRYVDPVEYGKRLRARVQAKRLVALAKKKRRAAGER